MLGIALSTLLVAAVAAATADGGAYATTAAASPTSTSAAVRLWPTTAVPAGPAATDSASVELGVKFTTSQSGFITGVSYYGTSMNAGSHSGSLWSAAGQRLATGVFATNGAGGWQMLTFASPVAVKSGQTYVASYHTSTGHYAFTRGQFATAVTTGSLTAPSGSNGVYKYGDSGFPVTSYESTNYWVTPVFVASSASTSTSSRLTVSSSESSQTTSISLIPPTSSSVASPALCATKQVWQNLDICGWPGPASTGYPAGQVFARMVVGGLTITTDGTVIDGYKVSGGIQVRAQNVTIRNSWVTNSAGGAGGSGVINIKPGFSATIDHSTLDGSNATHACVWDEGRSMTVTHNECIGVNDGIFSWSTKEGVDGTGDNFLIENNWLHDFTTQAANGHIDGYQTEGAKNGVIRHNVFDVSQDQDSAVAIWNGRKSTDNILVDNNLLAGGGFAAYAEDYSPSESNPAGGYTLTNVRFTNNKFSTVHFGCVGGYGVWFPRAAPSDGWRRSGNVVLESGQHVDAGNPTNNGVPCN